MKKQLTPDEREAYGRDVVRRSASARPLPIDDTVEAAAMRFVSDVLTHHTNCDGAAAVAMIVVEFFKGRALSVQPAAVMEQAATVARRRR